MEPLNARVEPPLETGAPFSLAQQQNAESDLAEMIDASPAVGFLQKFSLSPDAIRDLPNVAGPHRW